MPVEMRVQNSIRDIYAEQGVGMKAESLIRQKGSRLQTPAGAAEQRIEEQACAKCVGRNED